MSAEILERKLQNLFPDPSSRSAALELLNLYGHELYEHEVVRVQLAVLKLSDSDVEQVRYYTERAKQDYRDVLSWAEYPRQSEHWQIKDAAVKQQLIDDDKAEYLSWLEN